MSAPDVEALLLATFSYDPVTGHFVRLIDRSQGGHSRGIGKRAGHPAGVGYRTLRLHVKGKRIVVPEHRAAFLFMTGKLPVDKVDHLNGIRDDNRWRNLQDVSTQENNRNIAVRETGRQVVRIGGKYYPLLTDGYDCPREAAAARDTLNSILRLF